MAHAKKTIKLERTYAAPIEDIWELWTTKEGIESWWGPDEFFVKVHQLDLRKGGALEYEMTTKDADIIEYLTSAGIPVTSQIRAIWSEVKPRERLAYVTHTDFAPGDPEDITTLVEFHQSPGGVRVTVTADVMRSPEMTKNMEMGWRQELAKLASVLET